MVTGILCVPAYRWSRTVPARDQIAPWGVHVRDARADGKGGARSKLSPAADCPMDRQPVICNEGAMNERTFHDDESVLWTVSEVGTADGGLDRQGRRITPVDGYTRRLLFSSERGVVLMLEPPPNWLESSDDELRQWLRLRSRS